MSEIFSVAVIEDEEAIRHALILSLTEKGYEVRAFKDGEEAWTQLQDKPCQIIVLDIKLPRMDGLEFCRRLREKDKETAVIFLSSRNSEEDKIDGLLSGGDDYMTKPFSMRELLTRVEVCSRRLKPTSVQSGKEITYGSLKLNVDDWTAKVNGSDLTLTVSEFRILAELMTHPGMVFTREQLLRAAYPDDRYISDRNADAHIRRIRKKIHTLSRDFDEIETVYGVGYRYRP